MVADQILAAIPPIDPAADDPEYVSQAQVLLARHQVAQSLPLTEAGL